jgi:DNA-binding transcriptional LysR family regulator
MVAQPPIPLDHWRAFVAVVDTGSFHQAAEQLAKSPSAISYAMKHLQDRLPEALMTLSGRRAQITPFGEKLYRQAKQLLQSAARLEALAADLAAGTETQLTLAIDALTPLAPLFTALSHTGHQHPHTRIKVLETTLSGTDEALLMGKAAIALSPHVPPGFWGHRLCAVTLMPVVAPQHPLAIQASACDDTDLRQHRQIVLRDSGIKREQDAGWLGAEQRLTFSHFASCQAAVEAGLGFAFLPDHRVAEALTKGRLVALTLAQALERQLSLHLIIANPDQQGPVTQTLAEALRRAFQVGG